MVIGLIKVFVFNVKQYDVNEISAAKNDINFEVKSLINMPYAFADTIGCEYINIVKRAIGEKQYCVVFDDNSFNNDEPIVSLLDVRNPYENIYGNIVITGVEDEHGELTSLSEYDVSNIVSKINYVTSVAQGKEIVSPVIISNNT